MDSLLAGAPTIWRDEENYRLALAATPRHLEVLTLGTPDEGTDPGRLLAGFCWQWKHWPPSPAGIDDIPFDIEIGDWRKRWNLRKRIDGFPSADRWATDVSGAEQIGSVFTAQGFEFPCCGVLIGEDFRWDAASQRWMVDVSKTKYGKLITAARTSPEMEELIRNHYRVLLTRAMKATYVYSVDPATQAKLAEFINP